jgi:hypothetical protein
MEIDHDKIDEAVLALMWLTLHAERRASKGCDRDVTDRLYHIRETVRHLLTHSQISGTLKPQTAAPKLL